jgi:hypothetical protein
VGFEGELGERENKWVEGRGFVNFERKGARERGRSKNINNNKNNNSKKQPVCPP